MKLSLPQPYGIFEKSFETKELPDFTIITGLNGAGKSQLLEAIKNNNILVIIDNNIVQDNIKTYKYNSRDGNELLEPSGSSSSYNGENIKSEINSIFDIYTKVKDSYYLSIKELPLEEMLLREQAFYAPKILNIAFRAKKPIEELVYDDFIQHIAIEELDNSNYMGDNFAKLFKLYLYKKEHNHYVEFLKTKGQKKGIRHYSDKEFRESFKEPPWELVNQVLTDYNSNYRVVPPPLDMEKEDTFQLKFEDIVTKSQISIGNLSSGEKALMALTLAVLNSNKNSVAFPKLLLLDEPDAPLHPSMTKQFLGVIQDIFIKKKGVKVIMTTHSPTTVALAPKESLYVMSKENRIPSQTNKDEAIKLLTKDIPFLSVNYNKTKFVVVEAQIDGYFYQSAFEKLVSLKHLDDKIMFMFIPSRKFHDGGNSTAVQKAVEAFNENSDKDTSLYYGIIDWDEDNSIKNDNIKILGKGKRYSLENYIFDPLYLAAFFLDINCLTRADLELSDNENFWDTEFDESRLQIIADKIIEGLPFSDDEKSNNTPVVIKYLNKKEIKIPQWYLFYNWHTKNSDNIYDAKVKEIRNNLYKNCSYPNQIDKMKEDIIKLSIEKLPEFIPMDIVELFKSIQNGD